MRRGGNALPTRGRSGVRFSAFGLAALGILALALTVRSGLWPPRMQVVGCEFFRSDGSCRPAGGKRPLSIWLDIPPSADVAMFNGFSRLRPEETNVPQGRLFLLRDLRQPELLTIHVRSPWYRWRWQIVRFTERRDQPWLAAAWKLFDSNRRHEALAALQAHAGAPSTPEQTARQKALRAVIATENREPDAPELLSQAVQAYQSVGLVSDALELSLWRQILLIHERYALSQAEAELDTLKPLLEQLPQWAPWEPFHRAELAYLRGNLRGALEPLGIGLERAVLTGNNNARADFLRLQAVIHLQLGHIRLAQESLDKAGTLPMGSCRRFDLLRSRARLALRQAEAADFDPEGGLRTKLLDAAETFLKQALQLTEAADGCSKPLFAAQALTHLAQLSAQRGNDHAVRDYIAQAKTRLADSKKSEVESHSDVTELSLVWRVLLADAELRAGHLKEAEAAYRALDSGVANLYDTSLWALAGQAQIFEQRGELDAALDHYARAESYLDERSLAMPLGSGQGGYLSHYSQTTSRYVDLLLRRADVAPPAESSAYLQRALQVVRHARTRGLLGLLGMERLPHLPAAERKEYEAALDQYGALRRQLDELVGGSDLAESELPGKLDQLRRLQDKALLQLQSALAKFGVSPAALSAEQTARPIPPGQALLTCYPLRSDWACLLATPDKILVHRFPGLDIRAPRQVLAQQILVPFKAELESSTLKKLRVVAYGPMREIDVHLLPFGDKGKLLWDLPLDVVYAADLPTAGAVATPSAETSSPSAFLLFDTQGNLTALRDSATSITSRLRQQGYRVDPVLQPVADRGHWNGQRPQSVLSSAALLTRIGSADFFHLGSHFDYADSGGLESVIRLPDLAGLPVGDLLRQKQVPRYVTLFGCNTARTSEEVGGQEVLGLTQTFLFKGSAWVVGTARKVDDKLAAGIAKSFFSHLDASAPNPHQALRQAIAETRISPADYPCPHEADIGAYRVYEP